MELEIAVILCQGSDAGSVYMVGSVPHLSPAEWDGSQSILKAQSTLNKQTY